MMRETSIETSASGWCRDIDGALRRETIHSMLRRLVGWDYRSRAIYQITVTLEDRSSQALGRLEVKTSGGWVSVEKAKELKLAPEMLEARVAASAAGLAALDALSEMPRLFPVVKILAVQLMPDHLHFVVFVREPIVKPLGSLIRGFKAGAAKRWRELCSAENGRERNSAENARERNSAENGRARNSAENARERNSAENGRERNSANSFAGPSVWAEGFQDTILFHQGQLANMLNYLDDNPRRRAVKALFPWLFKVVSELKVSLDLAAGDGASKARPAVGRFMALGNRFLLERPLAQVQVSRSDFGYKREPKSGGGLKIARDKRGEPLVEFETPGYTAKKAALFAAARHGAVLISPCVSDGERQLAHEALAAGYPLITLQNKGFSPLQKPGGRYFDACADGRLLMLAPMAWPYQPGEKTMTRFDATAMNRLCQWIAGDDAVKINYHGMRPENIDALAREAAGVTEIHTGEMK